MIMLSIVKKNHFEFPVYPVPLSYI
jgi:hypothetical protein